MFRKEDYNEFIHLPPNRRSIGTVLGVLTIIATTISMWEGLFAHYSVNLVVYPKLVAIPVVILGSLSLLLSIITRFIIPCKYSKILIITVLICIAFLWLGLLSLQLFVWAFAPFVV